MWPRVAPTRRPRSKGTGSSTSASSRYRGGPTAPSHILAYDHAANAAGANSLVGTPDEIADRLERLRRAGVEYVIMNCGGSRESLRRFAREIMPAFADERAPA
jgi:alkanesulfonate monooxygenase SsuD/methylene tetrahydromethanopterin reductase-like flavin-dependent oxidoreductase (luciferase family)